MRTRATFGMITAGFMVICVAPLAEEFFFRGFFYRVLRRRCSVIVAALIDGAVFGIMHYDFSGADALLTLPQLALLCFMFCLVYQKTGSIWPVIALHAFINAIAYGVTIEDAAVALVLGPLMLVACALLPRLGRRRRRCADPRQSRPPDGGSGGQCSGLRTHPGVALELFGSPQRDHLGALALVWSAAFGAHAEPHVSRAGS